jgi:hypothetical protein
MGGNFLLPPFVLAFTNIGQLFPFRPGGGFAVEVDGNAQFLSHALSHALSHLDALGYGDILDRYKGANVSSADARMFAAVLVQVNVLGSFGYSLKGGLFDGRRLADKGNDSAVVIGVGADVEHADTLYRANDVGNTVVNFRTATVAKVGNAFNNLLH